MPTDINLQTINSMSQTKMNSLKDSEGKIPELANQLIITDDENTENYYKAGDGIKINNGVISSEAKVVTLWSGAGMSARDISLEQSISEFDLLIFYGFSTKYVSACVSTELFKTTDSSTPYRVNDSDSATNRYFVLYYKEEKTITLSEVGNVGLSIIEGVKL